MKNKTLKKTLLISTGLLAAGGICIGIGIAMGGSPVFYLDNEGIHLKETTACPGDGTGLCRTEAAGSV